MGTQTSDRLNAARLALESYLRLPSLAGRYETALSYLDDAWMTFDVSFRTPSILNAKAILAHLNGWGL